MKSVQLKHAIYIIERVWVSLIGLTFLGIIISFVQLKGVVLVSSVICLLVSFAVTFHIKIFLINFFLKRCKYHFEFVAVLAQLELTEDITIDWGEQNSLQPTNTVSQTQDFLRDNKLSTEYLARENHDRQGDRATLLFREGGLIYANVFYQWDKITKWELTDVNEHSVGRMKISYETEKDVKGTVFVQLDDFGLDKIDFMLLLTHFKAKENSI